MALQKIDGSMIGEVDDPRSGFQLIRRAWIHKYFRDHQIQYNPKLAMQHLISICEVREITPEMLARHVAGDAAADSISPQIVQQEKRIKQLEDLIQAMAKERGTDVNNLLAENEPPVEKPLMDYREMDMATIRKLAKTMGIVAERTDNKEQIIEKIEAHGEDTTELDERSPEAEPVTPERRTFGVSI